MRKFATILAVLSAAASFCFAQGRVVGTAVIFPLAYANGSETDHSVARVTYQEIFSAMGYSILPPSVANNIWTMTMNLPPAKGLPSDDQMLRLGREIGADLVISGTLSWEHRRVWVNLGMADISTCTVSTKIYDVRKQQLVMVTENVSARSDDRSNTWQRAGRVVNNLAVRAAVNKMPKAPGDHAATQIAIAKSLEPFLRSKGVIAGTSPE
ncbi:MAG: hypothetical protein ACK4P3_01555 [Fimbriimonadaceae bacterium]